jgi:hypothetical protein
VKRAPNPRSLGRLLRADEARLAKNLDIVLIQGEVSQAEFNRFVATAQRRIAKDVIDGVVPASATLSELDEYVDANTYFLTAAGDDPPFMRRDPPDGDRQAHWNVVGAAFGAIDRWITSGALLKVTAAKKNPPQNFYKIEVRSAHGGEWQVIDTATSLTRARDSMLGAEGLVRLRQGDLARIVGAPFDTRGIAVMTLARGLVPAPALPKRFAAKGSSWDAQWEGDFIRADNMIPALKKIDPRRLVLIGCDCARLVKQFVREDEERPQTAIDTAEAWAFGRVSAEQAIRAGTAAREAAEAAVALRQSYAAFSAFYAAHSVLYAATGDGYAATVVEKCARYASMALSTGMSDAELGYEAQGKAFRAMAAIVRRWAPLSAVLLSLLGEQLPFDVIRQNPRRRRRR